MTRHSITHQFKISGYIEDLTNNTEYSLNDQILSVAIRKDYMADVFPLFVVKANVTSEFREKLRKIKFRLAISIDQFNATDTSNLEYDEQILETNVLNTILKIYDPNITKMTLKDDDQSDDESIVKNQKVVVTFVGIPDNLVEINNDVINTVYENASMDEMCVDILGGYNPLYLDPSDNKNRERSVLIPPLNLSKTIEYLHTYLGIYDTDPILFFDTDTTYLCKRFKDKNATYLNKIDIQVLDINEVSSISDYNLVEIDDDNNIYQNMNDTPIYAKNTDVKDNEVGGTAIFGSYGSDYELVTRTYVNNPNENKKRYFWNDNKSELYEKAILNTTDTQASFTLLNCSPKLITPKTLVSINSDDENANGIYTISSCRVIFDSTDMKTFTNTILISCIK